MTYNEYAPLAELQRYRSYSRRKADGQRETWDETCDRTLYSDTLGLKQLGKFTDDEMKLIDEQQRSRKAFGSARWLWVGGTPWVAKPECYSSAFNCTSTNITDIRSLGLLMDLAMMGSGTGAVLEEKYISQLPPVKNRLNVVMEDEMSGNWKEGAAPQTSITPVLEDDVRINIHVGDSREGWVTAYTALIELACEDLGGVSDLFVHVYLGNVRPKGVRLKGFGGVADPKLLPGLFPKIANILNGAVGRKLNAEELCLIIDEAASVVVAGSIRRSAGLRQFDSNAPLLKLGLWQQDEEGNWKIDEKRDAMRMANHTRIYHHKPSLEECIESVRNQYWSGEGAIQYAPEAIARSSADVIDTDKCRKEFIAKYEDNPEIAAKWLQELSGCDDAELEHRMQRYGLNPLTLAA